MKDPCAASTHLRSTSVYYIILTHLSISLPSTSSIGTRQPECQNRRLAGAVREKFRETVCAHCAYMVIFPTLPSLGVIAEPAL